MREALHHWSGAHVRIDAPGHAMHGRQGQVRDPLPGGRQLRVFVDGLPYHLQPAQLQRLDVTPPRRHCTASATGRYDGAELRPSIRPGAEDWRQRPSRVGNRLHYRDGRVEVLA